MSEMKKWYESDGERSDVVISTRIRLARNLNGYPFPHLMSQAQMKEVNEKVRDALIGGNTALRDRFRYIEAEKLSPVELASLAGRHLISPEFAGKPDGRAILLMDDESVCIMLNEEDHVRIQVMGSGMQLEKAYDMADKIDSILDETLNFAFDEELGYLTSCPTNLGTGMRASLMLHLPASEADGTLRRIAASLGKVGATIRGSYGEGSQSTRPSAEKPPFLTPRQLSDGYCQPDYLTGKEVARAAYVKRELSGHRLEGSGYTENRQSHEQQRICKPVFGTSRGSCRRARQRNDARSAQRGIRIRSAGTSDGAVRRVYKLPRLPEIFGAAEGLLP